MSILGKILTGESATLEGQQAVLNVIMNRAAINYGEFGWTWFQQATAHDQFSCYPNHLGPDNPQTEAMIQAATRGEVGNIVPKSINYANYHIMDREKLPGSWVWTAVDSGAGVEIGGNTFWANDRGGSPGYDPSKVWKPNAEDKPMGTIETVAGEAAAVVDTISKVEPEIAVVASFIPGAAPFEAVVQKFAPIVLSFASKALHDIAQDKGGDVMAALAELFQHLTPGMPNSPTLSK